MQIFNKKMLRWAYYLDKIPRFLIRKKGTYIELNKIQLKKILFLESHLIGDIIMTLPLLYAIKERYPSAQIHYLGNKWADELLLENYNVSRIITTKFPWALYDYSLRTIWDLFQIILRCRKENYDLAMESRGDIRNNFLLWCIGSKRRLGFGITGGEYFLTDIAHPPPNGVHLIEHRFKVLKPLNIETEIITPHFIISNEMKEKGKEIAKNIGLNGSLTVAIHPGASRIEKRWQIHKHGELIRNLKKHGIQIILIGGPQDVNLLENIVASAGMDVPILLPTLKNFIAMLSYVNLLVAMDSAAAHIGAAAACNTIVIFGPVDPRLSRPWGERVHVIAPSNPPYTTDAVDVDTVYHIVIEILNKMKNNIVF